MSLMAIMNEWCSLLLFLYHFIYKNLWSYY